ncbi:MAG: hypothetical protein KDA73_06440 [Rhodobacteraceae bacterium]|nr:hypothetical protein [Paracoccaceae bacterium]
MKSITTASIALASVALMANCTAEETEAAFEDPGAFACREQATIKAKVDFSHTASTPINRDAFGTGNYNVTAAGQSYRCVVDKDNVVLSLEPI